MIEPLADRSARMDEGELFGLIARFFDERCLQRVEDHAEGRRGRRALRVPFVRLAVHMLLEHDVRCLLLVTVARGSKVPGAACSPFQSALTNHLLKWRTIMTTINLKRYYPYMTENVMLEVSDEIAAALSMGGRLCDSYKRQKRRNGECSLDTDPGFEADVLRQPMTPDEYIEARETTFALYDALAQLPPTQARRVYQHYLLGMSKAEIAAAEGVGRSRICCSIERGLAAMKNILKKSL